MNNLKRHVRDRLRFYRVVYMLWRSRCVTVRQTRSYLGYLLRHKWYVALECWRRRLFWQGLAHDLSKLRPSEFGPYARNFYWPNGLVRDGRRPANPELRLGFDLAWLAHVHRNRHHWEHWMLQAEDGSITVHTMPDAVVTEMVCDWIGAGKAKGFPDTMAWYTENRLRIVLTKTSRARAEALLGGLKPPAPVEGSRQDRRRQLRERAVDERRKTPRWRRDPRGTFRQWLFPSRGR